MNVRQTVSWPVSLLLAASCARISDDAGEATETLEIVETFPELGARDVPVQTQIDLCFSGLLDPRSVDDLDLTLRSGRSVFDSQLTVQLIPWREPGGGPTDRDRPWCPGSVISLSPKATLDPGLLYRVLLRPSPAGWHGEPLDTTGPGWADSTDGSQRFFLEFTTAPAGSADDEPQEDDPGPTLGDLFEGDGPFDAERGLCSCHQVPDDGQALALERLDVSTPDAAHRGLVTPTRTFDTGFPMVTPRRPSHSFLVQKLVRTHDGNAIFPILGNPMPPDGPVPYADFVAIARWIESGAER